MNKVIALVLVAAAAASAFPTKNENPQQYQGRNDLGGQEKVKIVPVVILAEGQPEPQATRQKRQYGRPSGGPPSGSGGRRPPRPGHQGASHSHPQPQHAQGGQGDYFGGGPSQGGAGGGSYFGQGGQGGGEYFGGPQGAPQESSYQVIAGGPSGSQYDPSGSGGGSYGGGGFESPPYQGSSGGPPSSYPGSSSSGGYYPQSSPGGGGGSHFSSGPSQGSSGSYGGSPYARQR